MIRSVLIVMCVALAGLLAVEPAYAQDEAGDTRIVEGESTSAPPGSGVRIRLVCGGSVISGPPPLFVIDGVRSQPNAETDPHPFTTLASDEIESIEIIRDGNEAVEIYGPEAAGGVVIVTTTSGRFAAGPEGAQAEEFALRSVYPNPSLGPATLTYDLPKSAEVRLEIYDLLGRLVSRTEAGTVDAGVGLQLEIPAASLSAGTYVYRLLADSRSDTGRFTVVR